MGAATPDGPPLGRIAIIGMPGAFAATDETGAASAIRTWYAALVRHPLADVYDLFVPTMLFDRGKPPTPLGDRGRVLPLSDLPRCLAHFAYDIVHDTRHAGHISHLSWLVRTNCQHPLPSVSVVDFALNFPNALRGATDTLIGGVGSRDTIICLSKAALAARQRLFDDAERWAIDVGLQPKSRPNTECIPFGVDTDRFSPPSSERERLRIRGQYGLRKGACVVVQVARLIPHDKADWEACLRLAMAFRRSGVCIVIAGADPLGFAAALRTRASELGLSGTLVVLPNVVDVARLLRAADIALLVANSYQEAQGLSVLEAMATGLPVVATDWDGVRELIVPDVTGVLVSTACATFRSRLWVDCLLDDYHACSLAGCENNSVDLRALIEAIRRLAQAPELRRALGENGRRRAITHYGLSVMTAAYGRFWSALGSSIGAPTPSAAPFAPHFGTLFGQGYGSKSVGAETTITFGRLVPRAIRGFGRLARVRAVHRLDAIESTLAGRSLRADEAVGALVRRCGFSEEEAVVVLMWCMSVGLGAVTEGAVPSASLHGGEDGWDG